MRFTILIAFIALSSLPFTTSAQITFPTNGAPNNTENIFAFTHALIYTSATDSVTGTLLIEGDKITGVGPEVVIPNHATVIDLKGKYIYPSFIDPFTTYGTAVKNQSAGNNHHSRGPQYESEKKGAYGWNENIQPELSASNVFIHDKKNSQTWLKNGFGTVGSHIKNGLMSGTGLVTTLSSEAENESVISLESTDHLSFNKAKTKQSYPTSLMGRIALIRQTYFDAKWYAFKERSEKNISLAAMNDHLSLTKIFECKNKFDILRADKIGDEFGFQYVFKGNGDEYQRIAEIKNTNGIFIIPLNFPDAYDVNDYYKSLELSLGEMQHWQLAPYNPGILEENEIDFAFTLNGMKDTDQFIGNLRKATNCGLSQEKALQALFQTPAEILNVNDKVGSLEKGKLANFIICSGNLFNGKTKINENWVQGKSNKYTSINPEDLSGNYSLNINKDSYNLVVKNGSKGYKASIVPDNEIQKTSEVKFEHHQKRVTMVLNINDQLVRLSGFANERNNLISGNGQIGAKDIKWHAILKERNKTKKEDSKSESPENKNGLSEPIVQYPIGGYGWDSLPKQETVLFRRARIWTNEAEGILDDCDLLIHEGKIEAIGQNLKVTDILSSDVEYRTVIAKDMEITAGIIDEHSHIAIERGVNESGQASSAEVRIGDVINPDDVNIYRQLAGGVTCSQLLHGSANPIGGQSAIIKLRWGKNAEEMKYEKASPFIKFALGENVKQSNWGREYSTRFPQTRMGVEQIYYDHFLRAKAYNDLKLQYKKPIINPSKKKKRKKANIKPAKKDSYRVDLEMEALSEILFSKRFITCHSYVQSEINMLMNVADSMGFQVNTFTHILEGYKLADKLQSHGAMASTFSDWWAYKYEVNDAIPYNAALMHDRGIVVGINSDDAEMGRRLNQEAAKAVKYGDVSEEEALKMVTLNPAKMLHIDEYVGSIKVGKDADIVLWTANPLSVYSRAEQTYVDGIMYYDKERDLQLRTKIKAQRAAIIKEMIAAKDQGEKSQKVKKKKDHHYHCDDLE